MLSYLVLIKIVFKRDEIKKVSMQKSEIGSINQTNAIQALQLKSVSNSITDRPTDKKQLLAGCSLVQGIITKQ